MYTTWLWERIIDASVEKCYLVKVDVLSGSYTQHKHFRFLINLLKVWWEVYETIYHVNTRKLYLQFACFMPFCVYNVGFFLFLFLGFLFRHQTWVTNDVYVITCIIQINRKFHFVKCQLQPCIYRINCSQLALLKIN